MKTISVQTRQRCELFDITGSIRSFVENSGVKEGLCTVYVPHTTAGIAVNENADPDVKADISGFLEKLVPQSASFSHAEGNSDSHIKALLTGNSKTFLVQNGTLVLGTWEGIFLCEFDGPRTRNVHMEAIRS